MAVRLRFPPVVLDALLAAVLTGLTVATLAGQGFDGVGWLGGALAILQVAPIALRQRAPVLTMAIIVFALSAYGLLGYGDFPNGGVSLLVAMFTVATLRTRAVAGVMFGATLAVITIAFVTTSSAIGWAEIVQSALVLLGAWMLGEGTRRWAQRAEHLAARAAQAVAEERVRIARELHDIVAHHMSVISLQAGLAEYVLDVDLPTARNAIATVGDASREALLDMRRLLDVLRVDHEEDADYSPQPGVAQLHELIDRTRSAGLTVNLAVTGPVRDLAPGADLCTYRVVQESLTNVLQHAGPATAQVDVDFGERALTVQITDDGNGRPRRGTEVGHGIRGMRERAELFGGVLTAQPAKEGGFTVLLRLPLDERR